MKNRNFLHHWLFLTHSTTAVYVNDVVFETKLLHVFVAATVKLQIFDTNEPDFLPLKQGSNWQHQLGLVCLYPWHIIMSALHLLFL